ncbi:MAG: hypothetical protein LBC75_06785 [Fibromonadaceae bacterium]|jgi:hypothetical protein|nr:hypothetical protein [Fibromonadaceae bacterium]
MRDTCIGLSPYLSIDLTLLPNELTKEKIKIVANLWLRIWEFSILLLMVGKKISLYLDTSVIGGYYD